ncbi:hypothetical protein HCZ30_11750 [Marivivens donghaensis]|uniref:Uncharacterized protein n=1 Tax=Marivivens donghaensis TaxID=1699413 RepID=A0ABX0VYC7_9RHOB|nr:MULTISPECIES: hypothetical protein [Marivivens]NIY73103.1 hypothetical protein [Marivivens donghaensis]
MAQDDIDPTGLIRESYRIDGITLEECRSIFFDWALKTPLGSDTNANVRGLLARYEGGNPHHPMTGVLKEALDQPTAPKRRGGRSARVTDQQ